MPAGRSTPWARGPHAAILLAVVTGGLFSAGMQVAAQQLPSAPSVPWTAPARLHLTPPPEAPVLNRVDASEPLSLAALIDLAEQRNPETRAAWQQARQAAAARGIARSALLPTLTGLVIGQTLRNGILFNTEFVRQTEGILEPALDLEYTVFDWNGRLDALRAARYDLYGANFSFNNVHLQVIENVCSSYYSLLNSQGQVAAALINLENARNVSSQVDARLEQGLATLPDALEARAAFAQAQYELANLQGAQSNAQAALATTLRLPASTVLPVVPLAALAPPSALVDTAEDATAVALRNRPDLLRQETRVAAADQRIRQARTAYAPQITFSGNWGRVRAYGEQDQLAGIYAATGVWNAQLNLKWTLFDGGRRANEVARAMAEKAASQAELDADRDRIEDQVWTAYTNAQTAFAQQQAAEALLAAAQSSYAAATQAFTYGVRTLVDVVTVQRTLAQARSQEVTARTNLFQQVTQLSFRTGELLRAHAGPTVLPPTTAPPAPETVSPQPGGVAPPDNRTQPRPNGGE
ncbi:TolC family protein [Acidipila sp. EB88]|uniref:TolC family protein n=1 Tax=Acidipila sp. EB88 TaxID=2305226 RepID=UPI0013158629|nr:TolC family protein [Acidipila sp. EB88]